MTKKASPKLDALLSKVKEFTKRKGAKTQLAGFLKVPASRVSEWLSGNWSPGGEVTLQMLEWVQAEEAKQQKSRGRASTRPQPKARKRKSTNENRKSSQP